MSMTVRILTDAEMAELERLRSMVDLDDAGDIVTLAEPLELRVALDGLVKLGRLFLHREALLAGKAGPDAEPTFFQIVTAVQEILGDCALPLVVKVEGEANE